MGNKEAKKSAPTELTSDHPLTRDIEHCDDSGEDVTISKSIADEISVERTRKQKTRHTLRTVSKVAFTQLGFGGLIVGYVILGALMFDAIESRYELERLQEKQRNRQHFVHQLYNHAYQEFNRVLNQTFELKYALWRGGVSRHDEQNNGWKIDIEKDVWERYIDYELLRYLGPGETDLYGKDEQQLNHNTFQVWTFASSIFYSITLITTIGYGNIAPKTNAGKIATMVYAMFGIPLMFMYLIYTGGLLADAFISVYSKMVNSFCRRLKPCLSKTPRPNSDESDNDREEPRHVPIVATLVVLLFYIAIGASLFAVWEHWHLLDAAYFCFITLTTIGLGDCVPAIGTATGSMASKAVICSLFLLFGLVLMVMSFKLMQHEIRSKSRRIARHVGFCKRYMNDPSGSSKNGRQEN